MQVLEWLYPIEMRGKIVGDPENALLELDEIIKIYKNSGYDIFVQLQIYI